MDFHQCTHLHDELTQSHKSFKSFRSLVPGYVVCCIHRSGALKVVFKNPLTVRDLFEAKYTFFAHCCSKFRFFLSK
jgi:hypothetical protein